jgi:hypothetical protein
MRVVIRPQRGAAITEMVIVLPMLLLVGLATIQFALIYEARATLNYAALMAARAGAVSELRQDPIRRAFSRAMVPLYSPRKSADGRTSAYARAYLDSRNHTIFQILNPTREAFSDFAEFKPGNSYRVIPNERLHLKSTSPGGQSGVNLQDANLLKLNVVYGYPLDVPFAGPIIARIVNWSNPFRGYERVKKSAMLADGRIPIQASVIVRMQSDAREGNNWVKSRLEVDRQLDDTGIDPPAYTLPGRESRRAWHSGPSGSDW